MKPKSNLERAKAEIRAAGLKFFCDKQKDGTKSLKVASGFYVPLETKEIPKQLYYLLLGASKSSKELPYRIAAGCGMQSQVVEGKTITRFYF